MNYEYSKDIWPHRLQTPKFCSHNQIVTINTHHTCKRDFVVTTNLQTRSNHPPKDITQHSALCQSTSRSDRAPIKNPRTSSSQLADKPSQPWIRTHQAPDSNNSTSHHYHGMIPPMGDITVCDLSLVPSTGSCHPLCAITGPNPIRVLFRFKHLS